MFFEVTSAAPGAPDVAAALASQEGYVRESLGAAILPASQQAAGQEVVGSEEHSLGGEDARVEFVLTLTRPAGGGGASVAAAAAQLQQQAL